MSDFLYGELTQQVDVAYSKSAGLSISVRIRYSPPNAAVMELERQTGLKIPCIKLHTGSNPVSGTITQIFWRCFRV